MSNTKYTPKIMLEPQWTVLNGMAFGLSQPTVFGIIKTNIHSTSQFEKLYQFFHYYLEIKPTDICSKQMSQHHLLSQLLAWISIIQQQHNVPVFAQHHIEFIDIDNNGYSRYLVALAYEDPELINDLLSWFNLTLNYFLTHYTDFESLSLQEIDSFFVDAQTPLKQIKEKFKRVKLPGMNTFQFVKAAHELKIPVIKEVNNIFRFGIAGYSRRLNSSITDQTSAIGLQIAKSKSKTALILRNAGLPAPLHLKVKDIHQLKSAIKQLEFPFVIKPDDLEQGYGVFANLTNIDQVLKAYKTATKFSKNILLEQYVSGNDYRLTVFNDTVIKVVKRSAAGITGDGEHTITELVSKLQQSDFFQHVFKKTGYFPLILDEEALDLIKEQNLTPSSIPEKSQFVLLRRKNNMSAGGTVTAIDLNEVHPDNIDLAIRAAQATNLDIAGIDLIINDITQSWLDTSAIICEVNAQPQIGSSVSPQIYQQILTALLNSRTQPLAHLLIIPDDYPLDEYLNFEQLMDRYNASMLVTSQGIWGSTGKLTKAFTDNYTAIKAWTHTQFKSPIVGIMNYKEVVNFGLPLAYWDMIRIFNDVKNSNSLHQRIINKVKYHTNNLKLMDISQF
jgi:cyanophycin synthetase